MPYKKKKTGTKNEKRTRFNSATQEQEVYYVTVDVFESVYESSSGSDSGYSSSDSYSSFSSGE